MDAQIPARYKMVGGAKVYQPIVIENPKAGAKMVLSFSCIDSNMSYMYFVQHGQERSSGFLNFSSECKELAP